MIDQTAHAPPVQPMRRAEDILDSILGALTRKERASFVRVIEERFPAGPHRSALIDMLVEGTASALAMRRAAYGAFEALLHDESSALPGTIRRSAVDPLWRAAGPGVAARVPHSREPHAIRQAFAKEAGIVDRSAVADHAVDETQLAIALSGADPEMPEILARAAKLAGDGTRLSTQAAIMLPRLHARAMEAEPQLAWTVFAAAAMRLQEPTDLLPTMTYTAGGDDERALDLAGLGPALDLLCARHDRAARSVSHSTGHPDWIGTTAGPAVRCARSTAALRGVLPPSGNGRLRRMVQPSDEQAAPAMRSVIETLGEAVVNGIRGAVPPEDAKRAASALAAILRCDRDTPFRKAGSAALRMVKAGIEEATRDIQAALRGRCELRAHVPHLVGDLAPHFFAAGDLEWIRMQATRAIQADPA